MKKKEETDMKMMKKLTTLMLSICVLVACFSMSAFAADGRIMFTDPEVKAGETVEVTGVVQKQSGNFGKIEITMKYDTDLLKFNSGDGVTESEAGKITYVGDATHETGERKEFKFSFTALKAGSAKIEITDSTIKNVSGSVLNYDRGASTITIKEGDGTVVDTPDTPTATPSDSGVKVDVHGVTYTIANGFPEDAIPEGYEAAKLDYDMVEYDAVYSEDFGLYLVYLLSGENVGGAFMYVEADATFAPYKEIAISESTTIALLSDASDVTLPEEYVATTVVLDESEFPAWQSESDTNHCVLYAINNYGEKALYQLDNAEGTYQRFTAPEDDTDENSSFVGKLSNLMVEHMDYFVLGAGLGLLLLLLIIVVLSVKLYNRNAELDELYEEYGIDPEDETKDDVVLDIEEGEEEEDYDEEDADSEVEVEFYVQESVKEIFAEENAEKALETEADEPSIQIEKDVKEEVVEETLGEALEKQVVEQKEKAEYYDDDDIFENFSVDFIDLDD